MPKFPGGGKAEVRQTESGIQISVTAVDRDASDTVVELKLRCNGMQIPAVEVTAQPK